MNDFVYDEPKTLPVILLLDNSGSMNDNDNIKTLNKSVNMMIKAFKELDSVVATISLAVISFGGDVNLVNKLDLVNKVPEINLFACGGTPFGAALNIAKKIIEDKESFPRRSYRPAIICVSDGMPNDDWQQSLNNFKTNGRTSKCQCMAMSIGAPKGTEAFNVLARFADGEENVFFAENAADIQKFFRFVTTTVTTRTVSSNPNEVISIDFTEIPAIDADDSDILL